MEATQKILADHADLELDTTEMSLEEISQHPIIKRVADRVASDVKTTSHTAHNSHYSSNA